jgi:hypothetical protein
MIRMKWINPGDVKSEPCGGQVISRTKRQGQQEEVSKHVLSPTNVNILKKASVPAMDLRYLKLPASTGHSCTW